MAAGAGATAWEVARCWSAGTVSRGVQCHPSDSAHGPAHCPLHGLRPLELGLRFDHARPVADLMVNGAGLDRLAAVWAAVVGRRFVFSRPHRTVPLEQAFG